MTSKQARQLKKRKRREEDIKRRRHVQEQRRREHERKRQYRLKYPEFRFDTTGADPAFVQLVKQAVATINFEDRTIFPPWQQELYRILKRDGKRAVDECFTALHLEAAEAGQELGQIPLTSWLFNLGKVILRRIQENESHNFLPFSDFGTVPCRQSILVIVRSLLKAKGSGGTVYYSSRKPTVEIDGSPKIVAFSDHAIRQVCGRIKPRWKWNYAALGDLFAFFEQCVYFERSDLYGGQLGFTFFDRCHKGFIQECYVDQVLGEENLDSKAGQPYYRVGYCPAVIEGDFIKAKTFLFPGYKCTPEYGLLVRSSLPWAEKRTRLEKVAELDAYKLFQSQDWSLIKWFHDNGVPQVVQIDREVFAPLRDRTTNLT